MKKETYCNSVELLDSIKEMKQYFTEQRKKASAVNAEKKVIQEKK